MIVDGNVSSVPWFKMANAEEDMEVDGVSSTVLGM